MEAGTIYGSEGTGFATGDSTMDVPWNSCWPCIIAVIWNVCSIKLPCCDGRQGKDWSQAGLLAHPHHVLLPAMCQSPLPLHTWLVEITGLLGGDLCSLPAVLWVSGQPLEADLPYSLFLILKTYLFFSKLLMASWIAPLSPEKAIWGDFWNLPPLPISPCFFPWCFSVSMQVFSPRVSPLTCSVFLYVSSCLAVHQAARCRMQW